MSIHPEHPFDAEVRALLERTRGEVQHLSDRVAAHNKSHPLPETAERVTFYCGLVTELRTIDPDSTSWSQTETTPRLEHEKEHA